MELYGHFMALCIDTGLYPSNVVHFIGYHKAKQTVFIHVQVLIELRLFGL